MSEEEKTFVIHVIRTPVTPKTEFRLAPDFLSVNAGLNELGKGLDSSPIENDESPSPHRGGCGRGCPDCKCG